MPKLGVGLNLSVPRVGGGAAPSNIPLSTTNINITYSGATRTLVKISDTFWYNERYGPNDPGGCEVDRFALQYTNSQWEFSTYFSFLEDGSCTPGGLELKATNAEASSSIPVSSWSPSITITAA
jgi:hypothetical protein